MSNTLDVEKNLSYLNAETVQGLNNLQASTVTAEKKENQERLEALRVVWQEKLQKGYRSHLFIKAISPKGLGVFADKNYAQGEILEYCHCIVSSWKQKYIFEPSYKQYAYWDNCKCRDCLRHGNTGLILLGTGSVVNSSETKEASNVDAEVYPGLALAVFRARKNIKAGEELLAFHGEAYFNTWCKPRIEQAEKAKNKEHTDILKDSSSPARKRTIRAISAET
jgi:hypothetical protein